MKKEIEEGVCGGMCANNMRCECCTCNTLRFYVWAGIRIVIVLILIAGAFKLGMHMGRNLANGGEWGGRSHMNMMRPYNQDYVDYTNYNY